MDKKGNFKGKNVAEILRPPSTKGTVKKNSSSSNTKNEDTRKRKKFDESTKNEEPARKIRNTSTNFKFKNSEKECFIQRLPPDLLSRIIELLPIELWPKMESISRKFQAATFCAWRNLRSVDLKLIDDKFSSKDDNMAKSEKKLKLLFKKLNERSPLISSISGFHKYVYDLDRSIMRSAAGFSRLRSIKFENLYFSPELLHHFFAKLKNSNLLTDLHFIKMTDVDELDQMQRMANDEYMTKIFRDTPLKLEKFSYEYNEFCGGEFLEFIDVSHLKKLILEGSELDSASVTEFLSRCTELRHLNINNISLLDKNLHFDQNGAPILRAIAMNCSKLETLEMRETFDFEENYDAVFEPFSRLVNLRRFHLSPSVSLDTHWAFDYEVFTAVTTYCKNLTDLYISAHMNILDPEFLAPLSHMVNLQCLHLTAPPVFIVSDFVRSLQDLSNLHTLNLDVMLTNGGNSMDSMCSLEKLENLTVYNGVKNKTLRAWARAGLINRLKVLQLISCEKVSDKGVKYMAKYGCENLEKLRLTKSDITVDGVRNILTTAKHLRELDVRKCPNMDRRELKKSKKQYGMVKFPKND